MNTLTPAEFFTRAIERVPSTPTYPQYRHKGVRLNLLRKPFAKYYADELNLTETLDSLIKKKVVVAVHTVWGVASSEYARPYRKLVEVERLECFPDIRIMDDNPILYLPYALPYRLMSRLSQTDEILGIILQPMLVVANS